MRTVTLQTDVHCGLCMGEPCMPCRSNRDLCRYNRDRVNQHSESARHPSSPDAPQHGPPQAGGAGDRFVSPMRRVVSMVLCGSARLLSQPACSTSPPVLLLGFVAGCIG